MVALTSPEDVLDALRTLHRDPGWAIVLLVEGSLSDGVHRRRPKGSAALAELVHLPGRRALIVVQSQVFSRLRGISTIPLADGRAFLAFDHAGGLADLEVAVLDQLEVAPAKSPERTQLMRVRDIVQAWRRDPRLVFRTKSIIVLQGRDAVERRPLPSLKALDARAHTDDRGTRVAAGGPGHLRHSSLRVAPPATSHRLSGGRSRMAGQDEEEGDFDWVAGELSQSQ